MLQKFSHLRAAIVGSGRTIVLTSVVITTLVVGLRQMGVLESLELRAFDQMLRSRPDHAPDPRLLIVAITEKDIQETGEATLSDQTLNRLLEKLESDQPVAIGIDILRDVPIGTGRADLLKRLQRDSGGEAQSENQIISVCKSGSAANPGVPPPPGIPEDRVGLADQVIDTDGTIRRSLLFVSPASSDPVPTSPANRTNPCDDASIPLLSLGFQLAIRYLDKQGIQPEFTPTDDLKLGSTVFKRLATNSGSYQTADVGGYQILLNYRSAENPTQQVTLTEVLNGKLDAKWVRDRIVLIGYTAASKKDDFWTPYSTGSQETFRMPGVVVHAQVVSQILDAVAGDRPLFWFWTEWQEGVWIAGWSLAGGILAWRVRHPLRFGFALVVAIGGLLGIGFVMITQTGWIPIAAPAVGLVATAVSVVLVDRFEKGGYAKKIYRGVQKLFKIEIDQEEKSRQLAEYEGLITKVQQWQQQSQELEKPEPPNLEDVLRSQAVSPVQASDPLSKDPETDYFEQLQQRVDAIANQEITQPLILELSVTEMEILEHYCQKTERSQVDVLRELIRSLQDH